VRFTRYFYAWGLVFLALSAAPASSGQSAAIGVVVSSENARADGVDATIGSNLYAAEEFATYEHGRLELRVKDCRIYMGANTEAHFQSDSVRDHLVILQGAARYRCPAGAVLWIETPAGIVHGAEGLAASGLIVVNDAHNLVITADAQDLVLDTDGELHLVKAGQSYRVAVSDDDDQPDDANSGNANIKQPGNPRRHRKIAMWLIGGGVHAVLAYEIGNQKSESPYKSATQPR
jgi:hypothetical protein